MGKWIARGVLSGGALLLLCLVAFAEEEGQDAKQVPDSELVFEEKNYRFRVVLPDREWLFAEREDTLVDVLSPLGYLMSITVHRWPDVEVGALGQSQLKRECGSKGRVLFSKPARFDGYWAYQTAYVATRKGVSYRVVRTWFKREDHVFCVIIRGPDEPLRSRYYEDMLATVELLEGEIVSQARAGDADAGMGLDWAWSGGVLRHAAIGVALQVPKGWSASTEEDAPGFPPDGGVVLHSPDRKARLRIGCVLHDAASAKQARSALRRDWIGGGVPRGSAEARVMRVGGSMMRMGEVSAEAGRHRLVGVASQEGRSILAELVYTPASRSLAVEGCRTVLASIAELDESEQEELRGVLKRGRGDVVGLGWIESYRGQVYRSFVDRIVMELPADQIWHIHGLEQPRADAPVQILDLEERRLGVVGEYWIAPRSGRAPEAIHAEAVSAAIHGSAGSAPRKVQVGTQHWLLSEGESKWLGPEGICRILTTVRGLEAHTLELRARDWRMPSIRKALDAFVQGVALPDAVPPIVVTDEDYTDLRFGYRVKPPARWRQREAVIPNGTRGWGYSQRWVHLKGTLLVSSAYGVGMTAQHFREDAGNWGSGLLDDQRWKGGEKTRTTIAGVTAEQITWKVGGGSNVIWFLERADAFFLVGLVSLAGFTPAEIEAHKQRFSFTD